MNDLSHLLPKEVNDEPLIDDSNDLELSVFDETRPYDYVQSDEKSEAKPVGDHHDLIEVALPSLEDYDTREEWATACWSIMAEATPRGCIVYESEVVTKVVGRIKVKKI
jgi:hypothetical protein